MLEMLWQMMVVSTEVVVDLLTSILYGIQALLVPVGICG